MENSWKLPWYITAGIIFIDTILKFMSLSIVRILWGLIPLSIGIIIIVYFARRKDPIPIRGIVALLFAIPLLILGFFIGNWIVYFWAAVFLFIYACLRWTLWKYTSKE